MRGSENSSGLRMLLKPAAWSLLVILAVMTIGPLSHRPMTLLPAHMERLVAWGCVGMLFAAAYPDRLLPMMVLLVGAAGLFEFAQVAISQRHARSADFFLKAVGTLVGISSIRAVQLLRPRK